LLFKTGSMPTPDIIASLSIAPGMIALFLLYFMLGFFLYAALFAAMGAMVNSDQETQAMQSFAVLPLLVPLLFITRITDDPLGNAATWLGMIPFTSPIAMPLRMAGETLAPAQIATSLALLLVGLVAVTWIAGRIYRIGILSTGKKPSFAELVKWIKAA
jgi:ABC-2 type transport system permease protein